VDYLKAEVIVNGSTFGLDTVDSLLIERNLNDIGRFVFSLSGDDNPDINEGDEVLFKIGYQGDTLTPVFVGEARRVKRRREEGERILDVEGVGWTGIFQYRVKDEKYSSVNAETIILDLVDDLVTEGKITVNNVESCTLVLNYTCNNKTLLEALDEVSSAVGYDFYVDPSKDLHWFPEGKYSTGKTLDIYSVDDVNYYEDMDNIINTIDVYGARTITPTDEEWTESIQDWSTSGTLYLACRGRDLSPVFGNYCVEGRIYGTSVSLERNCTLDLSDYEKMKFSIGICLSDYEVTLSSVKVFLQTDASNYFSKEITSSLPSSPQGWRILSLDIGDDAGWTSTGSPSWKDINKIKFSVTISSPLEYSLFIDNLYFSGARLKATSTDSKDYS